MNLKTSLTCEIMFIYSKSSHLKVDHFPESLQVCTRCFLLSSVELAVIYETRELLEPLSDQQLSLAHRRSDLSTHCNTHFIDQFAIRISAEILESIHANILFQIKMSCLYTEVKSHTKFNEILALCCMNCYCTLSSNF